MAHALVIFALLVQHTAWCVTAAMDPTPRCKVEQDAASNAGAACQVGRSLLQVGRKKTLEQVSEKKVPRLIKKQDEAFRPCDKPEVSSSNDKPHCRDGCQIYQKLQADDGVNGCGPAWLEEKIRELAEKHLPFPRWLNSLKKKVAVHLAKKTVKFIVGKGATRCCDQHDIDYNTCSMNQREADDKAGTCWQSALKDNLLQEWLAAGLYKLVVSRGLGAKRQAIGRNCGCTAPTPALPPKLADEGKDPEGPLKLCTGDCDSDADCSIGLKCFQRDEYTHVPGCDGIGTKDTDYCYNPDLPNLPPLVDVDVDGNDGGLEACSGDCDNDAGCMPGLACFQRDGYTHVPGCSGKGTKDWDYCYTPVLNIVSLDPTAQLGECTGDCDKDADCGPGLKCFDRNGDEEVPGCSGEGASTWDYCYKP